MQHSNLKHLRGNDKPVAVLEGVSFDTPWQEFEYLELQPGLSIDFVNSVSAVERGYLVMDGRVKLTVGALNDLTAPIVSYSDKPPSFLVAPMGSAHEITNTGDQLARMITITVKMNLCDSVSDVYSGRFDSGQLIWRDAIHGGCGRIATRHVLDPADFSSSWTFLDHAILSSEGSVGYHYHDALEESFIILGGNGYVTIDDFTFSVCPGSLTWQGIREGHGIYNPGPEPLNFLRIAVAQFNEKYTTIDLHDDLSERRPNTSTLESYNK